MITENDSDEHEPRSKQLLDQALSFIHNHLGWLDLLKVKRLQLAQAMQLEPIENYERYIFHQHSIPDSVYFIIEGEVELRYTEDHVPLLGLNELNTKTRTACLSSRRDKRKATDHVDLMDIDHFEGFVCGGHTAYFRVHFQRPGFELRVSLGKDNDSVEISLHLYRIVVRESLRQHK